MIKRIFLSVLVIFSIFVFSTPNTVYASWAKAFGYTDSTGGMVWPGADCNYYLWLTAGESTSKKLYFSELDSLGDPQWTKVVYGTGENDLMITQLADGGYFVYGTKTSTSTGDDIVWEKFNSSWVKQYGNTFGGANDESGGPNFTDDDGFLISGTTESYLPDGSDKDMLLVKVSSSGTIEWNKAIHHGLNDWSPSITEVSDGYLFTAEVENTSVPGTPGQDIVVVKLNKSGTIQWKQIYQGSIETSTWINSVSAPQEVTGGYLLWGSTKLYSGDLGDILLIKINSSGDIIWQKKYYDITGSQAGIVYRVMENTDGTFLLDGLIMNIGNYTDISNMLLMKLSSAGEIVWKKTLGGPGYDVASLTETTDGNYLLSGVTSDYTQIPYDPGNILYAKLAINLTSGSITYPWGSAKTFGSTGFESGGVFEYFNQYMLFGYTQSWGVGTLNALGIFYLDSDGTLPGCQYFQDFTLTEGTASLAASITSLASSIPTLTERQVGTTGTLDLHVDTATNPTATDICSATTSGTYSIAGTITYNGSALSGVTVTISGGTSKTTTTDEDGEYIFSDLSSGTYIITPGKTSYMFTPVSKQVTAASCAVWLGVDFTATTGGGGGCNTWADVIAKYNQYVSGLAGWADVISCYSDYVTP
ncbi:MAG: carboxypeptidase-like regulatory domain-containing protein [Proteobacteria bacterium]|nr:carboxypeptidase-like regulatory domain-containing protein [Pseudomonadota bacterium]